jgi:hypothetical protein
MYGARVIKSLSGADRVHMEFNGGGTFAANDFVKFDDSGEVVVATATHGILGVAVEAGTSSTDNILVDISPHMVVLMDNDNDSDTFAATDIGLCGDFTGATGAMQVDTDSLSSTIAQLRCLAYNPQGYGLDSDTSIGLFFVTERELAERET